MKTAAIVGYEEHVPKYVAALEATGIRPLVTLDPGEAIGCDGLLLPGGGDVDPARFGQENRGSREIDLALDDIQLTALDLFVQNGKKPILGICRGHQVVNVYFGGTLIQDLATAEAHMAHDHADSVHPVQNLSGSILHRLYGSQMSSNSSHHQGLADMGRGLRALSFAPDGVVEAAEHDTLPILTVQFHPERMCCAYARPDTVDGKLIFEWFRDMMEK